MQVGDVEAADRRARRHVARVAADALVAARAERPAPRRSGRSRRRRVLAGALERVGELDHGLRAERVADLGAVDRQLRDAVAGVLVADVLVGPGGCPGHRHGR